MFLEADPSFLSWSVDPLFQLTLQSGLQPGSRSHLALPMVWRSTLAPPIPHTQLLSLTDTPSQSHPSSQRHLLKPESQPRVFDHCPPWGPTAAHLSHVPVLALPSLTTVATKSFFHS